MQGPTLRANLTSGFTILEAAVASALLMLFIASAVSALGMVNRYAAITRLQSAALAMAQQRVDEILSTPWSLPTRPVGLQPSVVTETNLPLNHDLFSTTAASAFTLQPTDVRRRTTITDVPAPAGQPPRQVRATVAVTWQFRSVNYEVALTTLRASTTF